MKVLSLGAVAMDIVVQASHLPEHDGFSLIHKETIVPGGSSTNMSVTLQSLGVDVYQTGKIGEDQLGQLLRQSLFESQVDDTYLITKPGGTTLHTYVFTAPHGKHCIFANLGDAVMDLGPEDLPPDILDDMDCFYTDLFSPRASLYLGKKAVEKGIPVIFNMQCIPSFMESCGVDRKDIEAMIGLSTLLISGKESYFELTGEKEYKKGLAILNEHYGLKEGIICTLGSEGAYWLSKKGALSQNAYRIKPVDTTGAGDSFIAGLIYAYCSVHWQKEDALDFACGVGAMKSLQEGPRFKTTVAKVLSFMKNSKTLS